MTIEAKFICDLDVEITNVVNDVVNPDALNQTLVALNNRIQAAETQINTINETLANMSGGGSGDGAITVLADDIGGTTACDTSLSTNVIHGSSGTTAATVADVVLSDPAPKLGAQSIVLRMRVSNVTNTGNFLKVTVNGQATDGTKATIGSVYIKPSYFEAADTWESISFGVNFNAQNRDAVMNVLIESVSNSTSFTYDLDYIMIIPSGTALGSIG